MVIEATRGTGQAGDIAVDDISFSDSCNVYTGIIPTSPTVSIPTTTPFSPACE